MVGWINRILDFNFNICHRPGIQNILPDLLSRLFRPFDRPLNDDKPSPEVNIPFSNPDSEVLGLSTAGGSSFNDMPSDKEIQE